MKRHKTAQAAWPRTVKVGGVGVKVYKRRRCDGAESYVVADYSNGARQLRSFAEPGKALAEAGRIAQALASGEANAAQVSSRDLSAFGRALENLRPTGVAIELATATFARCYQILGGDRLILAAEAFARQNPDALPKRTVAECVDELLAVKKARGASSRYLGDLRARLARFAAAFQTQVSSVSGPDLQAWLDALRLGPQSVRNFQTVLGTLFAFAEARGYLARGMNPAEQIERAKVKNRRAVEIYSPAELAKLLAAAADDYKPILAIGAFTGIRAAELARLQWQDIDLAAGFVTVGASAAKTASRRIIPICPALKQWLAPWAGSKGPVWPKGEIGLRRRREQAAEAAGIKWLPNGLRHSAASYRLAQTGDAARTALELGNSPTVVHRHYKALVTPEQAAAWFAVTPDAPANVVALATA